MSNIMTGGVEKIHSAYFCSECGNLYDITNKTPESISETETSSSDKTSSKKIYFICTTCGNSEIVKPKTLILSKKSHELSKEYFGNYNKNENIINISTLPHTRDYICPNQNCQTHTKPELRDAVFYRLGISFKIMYICSVCLTSWK
jgi:hypothetical protein